MHDASRPPRRYGERILGLGEVLDSLDDLKAVEAMTGSVIDAPGNADVARDTVGSASEKELELILAP